MESLPVRPTVSDPAHTRLRQMRIFGICFLAGLLLGLVPTGIGWYQARSQRDALADDLRWANLEINLASAAVLVRHGDYAAARDAASRFFSDARRELDAP